MRNLAGLLLVLLVALVITNMSSFKGLSIIQLDRLNELSVGTDPGGALGIAGLDEGLGGAIPLSGNNPDGGADDIYVGEITNNFDIDIQFDVTVEVRATVFEPTGPPQEWQNINIFFEKNEVIVEELEFQDITEPQDPGQELTANEVVLSPGETLVVLLDQESHIHQAGPLTVDNFQGLALFSISGGSVETEKLTFNLEPAGDLRQQYFSYDHEDPDQKTGLSYPESEESATNLDGEIGFLRFDPESDAAKDNWYVRADNLVAPENQTILRVKLDNPDFTDGELYGEQVLKVLVRRTAINPIQGNQYPEIEEVELYQNDVLITNLASGLGGNEKSVTDPVGQVFTFYFSSDILSDLSGSDLEVRLRGLFKSSEDRMNWVEFGAIEWEYRWEASE